MRQRSDVQRLQLVRPAVDPQALLGGTVISALIASRMRSTLSSDYHHQSGVWRHYLTPAGRRNLSSVCRHHCQTHAPQRPGCECREPPPYTVNLRLEAGGLKRYSDEQNRNAHGQEMPVQAECGRSACRTNACMQPRAVFSAPSARKSWCQLGSRTASALRVRNASSSCKLKSGPKRGTARRGDVALKSPSSIKFGCPTSASVTRFACAHGHVGHHHLQENSA
eukprot:1336134-Prymnesium_polylepis.1